MPTIPIICATIVFYSYYKVKTTVQSSTEPDQNVLEDEKASPDLDKDLSASKTEVELDMHLGIHLVDDDELLSESSGDSEARALLDTPRDNDREKDTQLLEEERITRAKLQYISRTAHELRTPLQSFHLSLELLKQGGKLTPTQGDVLREATVAADLMKLTVNQALEVESVLSGTKLVPHRSAVSISATLQRVNNIM